MAVTQAGTREAVGFHFEVEGTHASISASKVEADGSHAEPFEKKQVVNHKDGQGRGYSFVTFPEGYKGSAFIVVQGSAPGSAPDEGKVSA